MHLHCPVNTGNRSPFRNDKTKNGRVYTHTMLAVKCALVSAFDCFCSVCFTAGARRPALGYIWTNVKNKKIKRALFQKPTVSHNNVFSHEVLGDIRIVTVTRRVYKRATLMTFNVNFPVLLCFSKWFIRYKAL